MSDPSQSKQHSDAPDDLALEVEEVTDLELPAAAADDVRGGVCKVAGNPNGLTAAPTRAA